MKKLLLLLTIATLTFTLFGCSSTEEESDTDNTQVEGSENDTNNDVDDSEDTYDDITEPSGDNNEVVDLEENTIEDIISATYEASGLELPGTSFLPLMKDNQAYMLGTDSFDFNFGIVSEPMIGSIAHSFVMFTVEEGADIVAIKEAVKINVDPRKWICVGVEPEQVVVENFGNAIVLIMDENSDILYEELEKVMEGSDVVPSELAESGDGAATSGMVPETEVDEPVAEIPDSSAMSLEEIINKMYEVAALELPMTAMEPLSKDNQAYMLGTDSFDFIEGVVSEPMMGSFAHSVVLFSVEEGSDIDAIKEAVKSNVDPVKWICVGVEDDQVIVESFGNTIVLIMEERSAEFYEALKSVIE